MKMVISPSSSVVRGASPEVRSAQNGWITEHGAKPEDTATIVIDGDVATMTLYERDVNGRFFLGDDGNVACKQHTIAITRPFPGIEAFA